MSKELKMQNIQSIDGYTFDDLVGGRDKVFEIPLFQRNYSWGVDACTQLFNDILNAYESKKAYYVGNFMFYKSSDTTPKVNKFILIDGQQRVTTLLLLLCAMRDKFANLSQINEEFLINDNDDDADENEKYRFKLKQNYNDYKDFIEIMNGQADVSKKSNIYTAYNTFMELLDEDPRISSRNATNVYNTIKNLESIGIELKNSNIENVQDIFEKINSTGVELSAADLIRNFLLFSASTATQEHLHNYWKVIEELVGEKNISKFAKAFLIRYTYEDISSEKVYFAFKKKFLHNSHEDILKDMIQKATFFAMIEHQVFYEIISDNYTKPVKYDFNDVNNQKSRKYNQLLKLRTTFLLLNKIGTDEINPFFFQLCDELYEKDLDKLNDICELILEFMIRYRVVQPSAGGGALSTKIRSIMRQFADKEYAITKGNVYTLLSNNENSDASRYPNNEEFVSKLKGTVLIKNARVLLYQLARRRGEEVLPFDTGGITVEHLMPQKIDSNTPEGKWWIANLGGKDKWEDVHNIYLNCIGNMALLSRSLNASISNGIWDNKRVALLERAMDKETLKVANMTKWSKKQMAARNDKLSVEISQIITGPKFEKKNNKKWL